ncbi:MAG: hypothetical protein MZW92_80665 [Comamonadaceae bacterium]|nr:hypothetical protein [Comamonadaceae bacterium]
MGADEPGGETNERHPADASSRSSASEVADAQAAKPLAVLRERGGGAAAGARLRRRACARRSPPARPP